MTPTQMAGVERIEVVKGAGSALYGSDALGGVVNIITGTKGARGVQNSVTLTAGSYEDLRVSDTFSFRGEKGGVTATGGHRTYDGFDLQPQNPQTIGQPAGRWWTGNGTADYQFTPKLVGRFFGDYQDRHVDPYYFAGATQLPSTVYNSIRDLTRYTIAPRSSSCRRPTPRSPRLSLRANLRAQINGEVPPGITDTSYQDAYQVWYAHVSKTFAAAGRYTFDVFAQVDNLFDEDDLYRRQTCPATAPPTCVEGTPINGANDLLQVWIAPRTFLARVTIGMNWTR